MRPIDADAIKEKFAEILESTYTDDYAKGYVNGLRAALNIYYRARFPLYKTVIS